MPKRFQSHDRGDSPADEEAPDRLEAAEEVSYVSAASVLAEIESNGKYSALGSPPESSIMSNLIDVKPL